MSSDQGGLQPCQDLVDNARTALEILLELGHRKHSRDPEAWFKVLNVYVNVHLEPHFAILTNADTQEVVWHLRRWFRS